MAITGNYDLQTMSDIRTYTTWLLEQDQAQNTDFWTDTIINAFIVAEHRSLCTAINMAYEDFFTTVESTDIVADQEYYSLPTRFRKSIRLEYNGSPTSSGSAWVPIEPIQPMEMDDYYSSTGVSPSQTVAKITYHFIGSAFRLVPFFDTDVSGGLRLYYHQRVLAPTEDGNDVDAWVPFNGLLRDHHEILAVGAVIRGKMREEVDNSRFMALYLGLYKNLINDVEQRQVQASKRVRRSEGIY